MKKSAKAAMTLVVCVAVLGGVAIVRRVLPGTGKTDTVLALEADGRTSFQVMDKSLFQFSKDGAKYYTTIDQSGWNDTYTMASPISVSEGAYAAVAELMGRGVRVYDQSGLKYSISASGAVVRLSLSKNGFLSLILYDAASGTYKVQVYSDTGTLRLERVEADENVYPLAADVSDDGRILAVAYFDGDDVEVISKVCLFYINETESEAYTDAMFAATDKKDELVAQVYFMEGNRLLVITDVNVYGMDGSGGDVFCYPLTNQLDAACPVAKNGLVLAYGSPLAGQNAKAEGVLEWLSLKGEVQGTADLAGGADYLASANGVTTAGSGRNYYGFSENGKLLWSYQATQDVADLLPLGRTQALVVTQTEASVQNMQGQESQTGPENTEPDLTTTDDQEG